MSRRTGVHWPNDLLQLAFHTRDHSRIGTDLPRKGPAIDKQAPKSLGACPLNEHARLKMRNSGLLTILLQSHFRPEAGIASLESTTFRCFWTGGDYTTLNAPTRSPYNPKFFAKLCAIMHSSPSATKLRTACASSSRLPLANPWRTKCSPQDQYENLFPVNPNLLVLVQVPTCVTTTSGRNIPEQPRMI